MYVQTLLNELLFVFHEMKQTTKHKANFLPFSQ